MSTACKKALRKHHCLGWCLIWVIDSPSLLSKCFVGVFQIIANVVFVFLFLFEVKCQLGYIHMQVFRREIEITLIISYLASSCPQRPSTNTNVNLPARSLIRSRQQEFLSYPWNLHSSSSLYCSYTQGKVGQWINTWFAPLFPISMVIVIYNKAQRKFLLSSLLQPTSKTPL